MKTIDANAMGAKEMSNVEMMDVTGGNPWVDLFWMLSERIATGIVQAGSAAVEAMCERAQSGTYQPYADVSHR